MKIRQGFVSNSSSSSFLIFGVAIDQDTILKIALDEYRKEFPDDDSIDDMYIGEALETLFYGNKKVPEKLYYSQGIENYYNKVVIGIDTDDIPETFTIKQAKEATANKINEFLGTKFEGKDVDFCMDAGYDS